MNCLNALMVTLTEVLDLLNLLALVLDTEGGREFCETYLTNSQKIRLYDIRDRFEYYYQFMERVNDINEESIL